MPTASGELTQTLKDGDQRLVLRQSFAGEYDAVASLVEMLDYCELRELALSKLGADCQLLHLTLKNDPVRGQRYHLEAVFVTSAWRNRKRQKAGRHS